MPFREPTTSQTQVQLWYNWFKDGQKDVNGSPNTSTTVEDIEAVKRLILDNRRIAIREVGISFSSCQPIFKNVLGTKRAADKIVPKLHNFVQKQPHKDIAQEMLTAFNAYMVITLNPKFNHPNESVQKS